MKLIVKGQEPTELSLWKSENAKVSQNLRYSALHGSVRRAIRLQMLQEQGFLCAYTMLRVTTIDDIHIEHIIPQNQLPKSHERDIDYSNMLACYPGTHPDPQKWKPEAQFGAKRKDKVNISKADFISPLEDDVDKRFQYLVNGDVIANASDFPATNTISVLKLNHKILSELRDAAIQERVFEEDLSAAGAEQLALSVLTLDHLGRFPEFCVAVSQALQQYSAIRRNFENR